VKGEDEIGRFTELGRRRNHKRADENRSGFVVRAGEDSCMRDRADGTIVSRKFRAVRVEMAYLHKAGERHCQHAHEA